ILHCIGPEEYPCKAYQRKRGHVVQHDYRLASWFVFIYIFVQQHFYYLVYAMQQPPYYKGPACAMPYTAYHEYNKYVADIFGHFHPAAAYGYVQVVPEPSGERYMPAAPEILNGLCQVGPP